MTKTTHTLGPTQQLVDLNEDLTNFDLKFTATSPNGAPFYAVVVDQATINVGSPFDYKHCTSGSISANIVADKGVYQNFFLALKSDKPCTCEVSIEKRAIPARPQPAPTSQLSQRPRHAKEGSVDWKMILIIIALIGAGAAAYYYVNQKKNSPVCPEVPSTPIISSPPAQFAPEISGLSLIDRLNNLPIS